MSLQVFNNIHVPHDMVIIPSRIFMNDNVISYILKGQMSILQYFKGTVIFATSKC